MSFYVRDQLFHTFMSHGSYCQVAVADKLRLHRLI